MKEKKTAHIYTRSRVVNIRPLRARVFREREHEEEEEEEEEERRPTAAAEKASSQNTHHAR
jgi:hypothetical protein